MSTEKTRLTCPECRGSLERIEQGGGLLQYRCRVGHAYSGQSAVAAHAATEENTLWAAVVALEEGADLFEDVANTLGGREAERLRADAENKRELAERVRGVLQELRAPRLA